MCYFLNFGQWASFLAKYGNFENQPLSQKLLLIHRKYAQFRHPRIERVCIVQLLNFGPWPSWFLSVKAHQGQGPWASCFFFFCFFL